MAKNDRRKEAAQELLRRRAARSNLLDFTLYTFPEYRAGWFHRNLASTLDKFLDDCVNGRSPRLMVMAPPRHGKSEQVSRRLPAYAFGRHPDLKIISCSYSSDLSSLMNRDVQRIIDSPEYRMLFPGTALSGDNVRTISGNYLRNSDIFEIVGHSGMYRSCGVGGGITGIGGNLLSIDDPVKDAQQAYSETYRQAAWEWYQTTFKTRAEKGAGILLTMTRWHTDDLAGRILKQSKQDGGRPWDVISFPAIAEHDEEFRKAGEALHEERKPLAELLETKNECGSYVWASLYQQRPSPESGNIVNLKWFQRYNVGPANIKMIVHSWDTGTKPKEHNNPTAGGVWAIADNGYYLLDVIRRRIEYPDLKRTVISTFEKLKATGVLIEDKGSGQSLIQDLRQSTNLPVIAIEPCGDKLTRMMTESPAIESGRVFLPETAPWLVDFEGELSSFPNGANDDQVDMVSQFLCWIRKKYVKLDFKGTGQVIGESSLHDY